MSSPTVNPRDGIDSQGLNVLENARKRTQGYTSDATRATITAELARRGVPFTPHSWQLDVAEALLLGVDCSVIAGTGAGKTLPFVLPLLVDDRKIIIIISPLNALEEDQAARFNEMGLRAIAINGETYSNEVHKALERKKYNVIITSPEMCLKHDRFRRLLSSIGFARDILAMIVDEAHCISQWGDDFRREYAELGTLRSFVPLSVPCLVASATMPPPVLAQVRAVMHIQAGTSLHVNLGTDRRNIAWFVRTMTAAKSDLEALSFLLPTDDASELPSTMVFFDDINVSLAAYEWFKERLPEHLRDQIDFYNSRRSPSSKRIVLRKFRRNEIRILFTTEAAGMGCDIPHVQQVVQFMVPSTLPIWMQRAGRAGRTASTKACAVLLVQPSVFQEVKKTEKAIARSTHNPEERNFRKNIDEGLRAWIETKDCRRNAASKFFGDSQSRLPPTGLCCDNCLIRDNISHHLLSILEESVTSSLSAEAVSEDAPMDVDGDAATAQGPSLPAPRIPATRRDAHLQGAITLLKEWRAATWEALYTRRPWGKKGLLPDSILISLATKTRYATATASPDVHSDLGWNPLHAARHLPDVLSLLADHDRQHFERLAQEKLQRAENKKLENLQKAKAKRAAEKIARERETAFRTPRPRASRAKPKDLIAPMAPLRPALSFHPNITHDNVVSTPHSTTVYTYSCATKENFTPSRPLIPQTLFSPAPLNLPDPPFLVPSNY